MRNNSRKVGFLLTVFLLLVCTAFGQEDDEDFIVPVRPSVSESANIQKKGVLQIETGGEFDFKSSDFDNSQAQSLGLYYAATKRLRLDFEFETIVSQKSQTGMRETGIGDVSLGFKTVVREDAEKHLAVAISYSIKLPTAKNESLGTGKVDHNLRFIFDRTIGKNDYAVNFSYLNVGREMSAKRDSGAQVILRYDRRLTKKLELINEFYDNTVDEDQPRGFYYNGALAYKINKRLQLDVGIRPGFGRDASNFGLLFGLSFGLPIFR